MSKVKAATQHLLDKKNTNK